MRPEPSDYAPAHAGYVSLVPEEDVLSVIETQSSQTQRLLATLDEERAAYRYAEGKWTVKEVLGHMVDCERIFAYRALCVARGETKPLPGFEQDDYMATAGFDRWRIGDLSESYALVRRANIVLFRNLPDEAWARRGTASNNPITVRALAYIIVGHERHHLQVLREKYQLGQSAT